MGMYIRQQLQFLKALVARKQDLGYPKILISNILCDCSFSVSEVALPTGLRSSCQSRVRFLFFVFFFLVFYRRKYILNNHRPTTCHSVKEMLLASIIFTDLFSKITGSLPCLQVFVFVLISNFPLIPDLLDFQPHCCMFLCRFLQVFSVYGQNHSIHLRQKSKRESTFMSLPPCLNASFSSLSDGDITISQNPPKFQLS